jgi:DNA-binding transcriptional LysR family regulator
MELRDIEIFLTLAEELHFGRTAERLHVSVARVSQAIKKQERAIGTQLFARDNRNVQLTPAGVRLRDDLRPIYRGLQDSIERARMAAKGVTAVLRLGLMPFNVQDLHPYWQAFRSRHPHWGLRLHRAAFNDTFDQLRDGDLDALLVWLPVKEPDLTVGPVLCTDRRVLAVSVDHELATESSVSLEMLADFQHAVPPRMPGYWLESYLPSHTPQGRPIERHMLVENGDELINLVTTGEIVHPFPAHVTRYWSMPHVRWLPITDLPVLRYALVWRTDAENDLIRALAEVVRDLGTLEL